jgi:hypothetical protein
MDRFAAAGDKRRVSPTTGVPIRLRTYGSGGGHGRYLVIWRETLSTYVVFSAHAIILLVIRHVRQRRVAFLGATEFRNEQAATALRLPGDAKIVVNP